jgi:hypothetical protein
MAIRIEGIAMNMFDRLLRILLATVCATMLAACGGGDDEEDEDDFDNDVDVSGYWTGTVTPDGGTASNATLFVGSDGKFVILSNRVFFNGTGSTSSSSFSASATGYAPAGNPFPNSSTVGAFTLMGTATAMSSITGSYSGASESGRLAFTYNSANSTRLASLSAASGSYTVVQTAGAPAASLVVSSSGALTFNVSTGCMGTGQLTVVDAAHNYYSWTLSLTACTNTSASGIGFMTASNFLNLVGTGNTLVPFVISATK